MEYELPLIDKDTAKVLPKILSLLFKNAQFLADPLIPPVGNCQYVKINQCQSSHISIFSFSARNVKTMSEGKELSSNIDLFRKSVDYAHVIENNSKSNPQFSFCQRKDNGKILIFNSVLLQHKDVKHGENTLSTTF